MELNELRWWSLWADLRRVGKGAYVLTSDDLPEIFFNKGSLIGCQSSDSTISKLEAALSSPRRTPALMIFETCSKDLALLSNRGYGKSDTMTVMALEKSQAPQNDVVVFFAKSAEDWAKAYLLSFYGELGLLPVVRKTVAGILRLKSATLLEATIDGQVAGGLAIFRTNRLAGFYCVGTVPKFRRRGVAGALLAQAMKIASVEDRTLFLQTLESDHVEEFYRKRGFKKLYTKALMNKKGYYR
jgi:ribosomal protein S18 acetylase RimI-like enzyme